MKNRINFAALVAALLLSTGCTLTARNALQVNQKWQGLDEIAEKAGGDLQKLVGDLSIDTTTSEPIIGPDGRPVLGPDGEVLYRTTQKRTERGLPSAPSRVDLYGDSDFIKSTLGFTMDNNGDGSSLRLDQVTDIDTKAYQTGVREQSRQIGEYTGLAKYAIDQAGRTADVVIKSDENKAIAKDNNDLVIDMAKSGFAQDKDGNWIKVAPEEGHASEEPSPAEPPSAPAPVQ